MMAPSRGTECNQTPNAMVTYSGVSVWVITSIRERKRVQDRRLRSQKQPSFKECVIAH